MTGCLAYLDSTDLVDLRTLFNEGVHKTDVVVILATKGVFTRPWCLMEMWEAAVTQVPIVLFPVVGQGFELKDAVQLLGNLETEMPAYNPTCVAEVMAHVCKQGVTDVREVEDVLLAQLGLVATLVRAGRPASVERDEKLCARLKKTETAALDTWLAAHHDEVVQRLGVISWQSWGTDNQIIASVQTLVDECAAALGRAKPQWKEHSTAGDGQAAAESTVLLKRLSSVEMLGLLKRLGSVPTPTKNKDEGRLLIVCARDECGGPARLLQQLFGDMLGCEVVIGTDQVDLWRSEVEAATRGVVLLQTKSVLRDAVRLLQLFLATKLRRSLVCVNVVGGGYDFAKAKPLLLSLSSGLPVGQMMALRTELIAQDMGVGQLASSLSRAVPNAISVFFNPAAGDAMVDAAVRDIVHKLEHGSELLRRGVIQNTSTKRTLKMAGKLVALSTRGAPKEVELSRAETASASGAPDEMQV